MDHLVTEQVWYVELLRETTCVNIRFFDRAASTVPNILRPYHRSLHEHIALVAILRSHSAPFEDSRRAIAKWAEQAWLEDSSWDAQWEDLCAAEVDKWNSTR